MTTIRDGAPIPVYEPDQHLYRVVVTKNNMSLGPRMRQSGDSFHATELSPEIFKLIRDGIVQGAHVEELSSGRLPPLQIPDVISGYRDDGTPIMIPGDRRANQGFTFSVHGNVSPNRQKVEAHPAALQNRRVEHEAAAALAEEHGLDFEDGDTQTFNEQLTAQRIEGAWAAQEVEEQERLLAEELEAQQQAAEDAPSAPRATRRRSQGSQAAASSPEGTAPESTEE